MKTTPRKVSIGGAISALFRLGLLAGFVVLVFIVLQRPEMPVDAGAAVFVEESELVSQLQGARADALPITLEFPWTLVNGLMETRLETAEIVGLRFLPVELGRCFVIPGRESCEIVMERTLYGFSHFTTLTVVPVKTQTGYTLQVSGGSIGRLRLPADAMLFLNPSLSELAVAFDPELELLRSAKNIRNSTESLEVGFGPR